MIKPNGVHHLAISTGNIKSQLEFFTDVLGMELVALYDMHGVPGAWHGFVKASDSCYVAFVAMDGQEKIEPELGRTHAGNGGGTGAGGTMQHVALNVESEADLLAMRDRIRLKGVHVFGPINHGFCKSIYFAGPEMLTLEVSTSEEGIDARQWIDPVVAARSGISAEELERYKRPASVEAMGGRAPQPPMDLSKPHMKMPPEDYKMWLLPDDEFAKIMDFPNPPIDITRAAAA